MVVDNNFVSLNRGRGILKLMGTGGVESAVKLGVGHQEKGVEEL